MKTWMLALSLVAVIGMTGLVDGKGKGKGGMKGKIASVGTGTFTMTMGHHGKKNAAATTAPAAGAAAAPQSMIVKFDATTLVNGVAGGKIDSSMVGKRVTVVGGTDGTTITATSITITDGHKKKKNAN